MSRNSETIFTNLPQINIQRSIMDIPQDHKTTFNVGELIPFYCAECLPSDSVRIRTNKVIRLQTLLTPLMSELVLDTFYFFIPNRLVWSHWKQFMGENTESAYLPEIIYRPPNILAGGDYGAVKTGDILDYFGMPLISSEATAGYRMIQFPLRGYWLCWNEFFRDQNLQDPINIPLGDSDINFGSLDAALKKPLPVNRLHDYFSSALKAPAKNDAGFVTAWSTRGRITSDSPYVNANDIAHKAFAAPVSTTAKTIDYVSGDTIPPLHGHRYDGAATSYQGFGTARNSTDDGSENVVTRLTSGTAAGGFVPDNLYADLFYNQFGITIPDLRQAFQMQKFLEREASHGSRYQEVLLAHFSTKAMDSRLQRPEYLGGNRIPLNVSQVVNQAQASGEYLGDVGALSLTTDSHFDVEYACQEHGFILGLCAVRYKSSYSQGYSRQYDRVTRYDYAWPEFSHLTDQAIFNSEVYFDPTDEDYDKGIFGYAERYAEYKYAPDRVSGEMRPGISNSLASWHLGDYYTDQVFLSDEWLKMSKAPVDRALAVTSAVSNQVFGDFYIQARWTRPLPVHSNPGFADHF